jgi:hypothetical protein
MSRRPAGLLIEDMLERIRRIERSDIQTSADTAGGQDYDGRDPGQDC